MSVLQVSTNSNFVVISISQLINSVIWGVS